MGRCVSSLAHDKPVRMNPPAASHFSPEPDMGARLSLGNGCRRSAIKGGHLKVVENGHFEDYRETVARITNTTVLCCKDMIVIAMEEERALVESNEPVLVTGIGAINVMRALKDIPRDTPITNIGYAGSNHIPIGETVKIGKVALYHPNVEYAEPEFHLDGDTPCYTGCDFVTDTDIQEVCVFDMELAFILGMGFADVTSIKTISDNLDKSEYDAYVSR